jgi:hypothetical protein
MRALESELNYFVIKDDESPQDMYNRSNKIINKIKSLGSIRWGRREVVDKILRIHGKGCSTPNTHKREERLQQVHSGGCD